MQDTPLAPSSGDTRRLPITAISEGYAHLRVANPKVEAALTKSLAHLGQLNPVVVGPSSPDGHALLDGFKRLRILRRQGHPEILAREVPARKSAAQKSLLFTLHGHIHGLSELEEALIVKSLHREDGLSQGEIGMLLMRHKSWVCRRIALLERLAKDVLEHLVLRLMPLSVARVLCQLPSPPALPRGNGVPQGGGREGLTQEKMLAAILKHRLTARECEALFKRLRHKGPAEVDLALRAPYAIEPALSSPHAGKPLDGHLKLLSQVALGAIPKIRALGAGALDFPPERVLVLGQTAGVLSRCQEACHAALQAAKEVP